MKLLKKLCLLPAKCRQYIYTRSHQRPFVDAHALEPYIKKNRETLASVKDWIDADAMAQSFFAYGVPDTTKPLLNMKINNQPTYTDVISKLLDEMKSPVNYLEVGVSVGKNFLQLASALSNAMLTGFDVEDISPVLQSRFLGRGQRATWQPPATSIRRRASYLADLAYGSNKVQYLCGDVFDEAAWKQLEGRAFNFIYSDAFHSADALLHEWEMIKKYGLLNQKSFICMWDDLGGDMTDAFAEVSKNTQSCMGAGNVEVQMHEYNGWNGQHEDPHLFGLVRLKGGR